MSRTIFLLCFRVVPGLAGLALLLWSPFGIPPPRLGPAAAWASGAALGLVLFALLARPREAPSATPRPVVRAAILAAPALLLGAIEEETVWRYAAFGLLLPTLGPLPTLAVSSTLFALAHVRRELGFGALRSHLPTGVTFGGAYLLTGRLSAAIVAHVAYNLLVVASATAWPNVVEPAEASS
jgi:membrane protease YdiL (CAAX protease family)